MLQRSTFPLLLLVVVVLSTSPAALAQTSAHGHWITDPKNVALQGSSLMFRLRISIRSPHPTPISGHGDFRLGRTRVNTKPTIYGQEWSRQSA